MLLLNPGHFKKALCLSASLILIACGGGGGSSSVTPVVTGGGTGGGSGGGGSSAPTWQQGVFAPASQFKDQCANPRSGTDIQGNAFPDQQGTTTLENFWLRSWSDETYLWYNEITDRDPATFSDRLAYFDVLKTTATTASGTPKDQFHFSQPTDDYLQSVTTGSSASYGARFSIIRSAPPRDIRVAFTQDGTPADGELFRGTQILEVDGVDAVNGASTQAEVNTLNEGLFPSQAGVAHTFRVRDVGSGTTREVTLTSQDIATEPVQKVQILNTPTGDVGYLHFTTFGINESEASLVNAFTTLSNAGVSDLVLDLRYNGGGFLAVAGQLGYMAAGDTRTDGRTFDRLTFNDKHPVTNPVTGQTLTPTPFYDETLGFSTTAGQALPSLDLPRVFILTTGRTCSASEAVINGLRGVDVEVIQIGARTCGKPYGFYPTDNCGETYFTIQFSGQNDKGFGDYADGFQASNASNLIGTSVPGCEIGDDYDNPLGDEGEGLLAAALQYRADGTCPTVSTKSAETVEEKSLSDGLDLLSDPRIMAREFQNTSRIDGLPGANRTTR